MGHHFGRLGRMCIYDVAFTDLNTVVPRFPPPPLLLPSPALPVTRNCVGILCALFARLVQFFVIPFNLFCVKPLWRILNIAHTSCAHAHTRRVHNMSWHVLNMHNNKNCWKWWSTALTHPPTSLGRQPPKLIGLRWSCARIMHKKFINHIILEMDNIISCPYTYKPRFPLTYPLFGLFATPLVALKWPQLSSEQRGGIDGDLWIYLLMIAMRVATFMLHTKLVSMAEPPLASPPALLRLWVLLNACENERWN